MKSWCSLLYCFIRALKPSHIESKLLCAAPKPPTSTQAAKPAAEPMPGSFDSNSRVCPWAARCSWWSLPGCRAPLKEPICPLQLQVLQRQLLYLHVINGTINFYLFLSCCRKEIHSADTGKKQQSIFSLVVQQCRPDAHSTTLHSPTNNPCLLTATWILHTAL